MTAATYQYVDLPDASVVTTRALLTARETVGRSLFSRPSGSGSGHAQLPQVVELLLRELVAAGV
ncbi:hypothetical protein [Streptomyces lavendofoliae]|uniref:hypothetical protein n=1 Tax=Streptomyces lavendofoliae TaxID=67314 RepID=UPI003D8FBC11